MKKIPTVFVRNPQDMKRVLDTWHPDALWVAAGEGEATRKYDGTCCLVRDGKLYKRHELRPGKRTPDGFEPAQDPDPTTGKQPGWVPVGDGPEDAWHREAWAARCDASSLISNRAVPEDGTYELIGPKVQGNPEGVSRHVLIFHDRAALIDVPDLTYDGLRDQLLSLPYEGIVWHHPDGRMAKLKRKDFA